MPSSEAYEEIHEWLIPDDWEGEVRNKADQNLQSYIKQYGIQKFQAAVSAGQYTRPKGLFYGGIQEEWSNVTLRKILSDHVPQTAKGITVVDLHTGLGPMGYGEIMFLGNSDSSFEKAKQIFGPETKNLNRGESTSAIVSGTTAEALNNIPSSVEVISVALEFGTVPIMQVLTALRADHWLHGRSEQNTHLSTIIKQQILDAFYVDTKAWKAAVYGRTADIIFRIRNSLQT